MEEHSDPSSISDNDKFEDICKACRIGDFESVELLLSTPNLDINKMDEWDYSPLILASLCGHKNIVELLLARGAVCDRDTFQGARCVYGALTDEIRELLISFDITKQVDNNQPFASHISSLVNDIFPFNISDLLFYSERGSERNGSRVFTVNRFLLAARSSVFHRLLSYGGDWYNRSKILIPEHISPQVFEVVVNYIYLKTNYVPQNNTMYETIIKQAEDFGLNELITFIKDAHESMSLQEQRRKLRDYSIQFVETARINLRMFLNDTILSTKLSVKLDLNSTIDFEDIDARSVLTDSMIKKLLSCGSISDIIVCVVDIETESIIFYAANKAMLCKSEYFSTMFETNLFKDSYEAPSEICHETSNGTTSIIDRPSIGAKNIPVVRLSPTASSESIAEYILFYLYNDNLPSVPLERVVELLFAADELLLDKLKTTCAISISSKCSKYTYESMKSLEEIIGYGICDLMRVAWQTRCDKLEQFTTKIIAYSLHEILSCPQERSLFSQLVRESAKKIQERQDIDTIDLIDDIRYYLSEKHAVRDTSSDFVPTNSLGGPNFEQEDIPIFKESMLLYDTDLALIDNLLEELHLNA